jgi:Na+-driven multidrug efflux pump
MLRKEAMRDEILNGSILKTSFKLSWPVMLSHAFQTFYNMTDAFWLGLGIGNVTAAILSLAYLSRGRWMEKIID